MQHSSVFSRISISTAFSIFLFIILFTTNALAVSLRPSKTRDVRKISIPRALLEPRQEFNATEAFLQACGEGFVVCPGAAKCCERGRECLIGSQTGQAFCRDLVGSTDIPTSTPPPSSSSSKAPIGAIVGGVLGGVAAIAIVCILYLLHRRRRPTATPAIPQAPIPNLPNVIEAKYPPPHETSYSGDNWPPGSFLYHSRNRSVSTSTSCISPDNHTPLCEPGIKKYNDNQDQDAIMELPGNQPTMELQGDDGYFAIRPYVPPPPTDNTAPLERTASEVVSPMSPQRASVRHWRMSR